MLCIMCIEQEARMQGREGVRSLLVPYLVREISPESMVELISIADGGDENNCL